MDVLPAEFSKANAVNDLKRPRLNPTRHREPPDPHLAAQNRIMELKRELRFTTDRVKELGRRCEELEYQLTLIGGASAMDDLGD